MNSNAVCCVDDLLHRVFYMKYLPWPLHKCSVKCFCGCGYNLNWSQEYRADNTFHKILIEWEDHRRDYKVGRYCGDGLLG